MMRKRKESDSKEKESSRESSLRQIRRYQRSTQLSIPSQNFACLVGEVVAGMELEGLPFEAGALKLLHEAGEQFLTGLFEDITMSRLTAKKTAISPADVVRAFCLSCKKE